MEDILNNILSDNVTLTNNKYLIFYIKKDDKFGRHCYGTFDTHLHPVNLDEKTLSSSSGSE
uniref:Late expression factor 10 n=1 Tax=Adoxophyes orana granulovirus TaxID=170617 RepID=A0A0A7V0T2_GVAO|nr:late expression factor 10 [Adoxophyes orana granulovirus]